MTEFSDFRSSRLSDVGVREAGCAREGREKLDAGGGFAPPHSSPGARRAHSRFLSARLRSLPITRQLLIFIYLRSVWSPVFITCVGGLLWLLQVTVWFLRFLLSGIMFLGITAIKFSRNKSIFHIFHLYFNLYYHFGITNKAVVTFSSLRAIE